MLGHMPSKLADRSMSYIPFPRTNLCLNVSTFDPLDKVCYVSNTTPIQLRLCEIWASTPIEREGSKTESYVSVQIIYCELLNSTSREGERHAMTSDCCSIDSRVIFLLTVYKTKRCYAVS